MWYHKHSSSVYKSPFYHFTHNTQQEITPTSPKTNRIQHSLLNTELVHLCDNLQKCFPLWQCLLLVLRTEKNLYHSIHRYLHFYYVKVSVVKLFLCFFPHFIVLSVTKWSFWGWSTGYWAFLPETLLSFMIWTSVFFYQVITSQQSWESLLSLYEKQQNKEIGHSIASKALALASLSSESFIPERKGRPTWRTNRTEQDR